MGPIGSVQNDPRSKRLKGFIPIVCTSLEQIRETLSAELLPFRDGTATRASVRMFTGSNIRRTDLDTFEFPWGDTVLIPEAYIPLGINGIGALLYIGGNTSEREMTSPEQVARQWSLLQSALSDAPSSRPIPNGFSVEILQDPSRADLEDLVEVLSGSYTNYMTELNMETVGSMFAENTVAVVRNEQRRIVASSQGETAELYNIVGASSRIKLVELTETATLPPNRGRGLARACKETIMREIRADLGACDLLLFIAESRCVSRAVIRQNHALGGKPAGRLPQHCLISSPQMDLPQDSKYGDLYVFYWSPVVAASTV